MTRKKRGFCDWFNLIAAIWLVISQIFLNGKYDVHASTFFYLNFDKGIQFRIVFYGKSSFSIKSSPFDVIYFGFVGKFLYQNL